MYFRSQGKVEHVLGLRTSLKGQMELRWGKTHSKLGLCTLTLGESESKRV